MAFGQAVRTIREKLGWTQEQLGSRAGLHRNYVGGGEINLTLKGIGKLARAAETEPSLIFEIAEEKQRAVARC